MQELMRSIKGGILIIALFASVIGYSQAELVTKWKGETYLMASFFRLGSYQKERPTIFLEQTINYRLNERFSLGAGFGVNAYPALLGFPVHVNGKYNFKIKNRTFSIIQSYGRNIKFGDISFNSNRYLGELRMILVLKNVNLTPRIGYNYLWDGYDGRSLSFLVGVGLKYDLFSRSKKDK